MRTLLMSILFTLLVTQSVHAQGAETKETVIGVLAFDRVLTSEITAPIEVFGAAAKKDWFSSHRVLLLSGAKNKQIVTEEGLTVIADATIHDDIDLDVLIVPGSYDLDRVKSDKPLMAFLRNQGQEVRWLGSNCSGAFLLAHAGLLDGVKATTWAGGETDLKKSYPSVDVQFDRNVVVDGRVITSNGGVVSYEAALTLLSKLSSPEHANEISELLQFPRVQNKD